VAMSSAARDNAKKYDNKSIGVLLKGLLNDS